MGIPSLFSGFSVEIFLYFFFFFFFSSRRRHTRLVSDWSSDVCSSDLSALMPAASAALAMKPKWRLFAKLCTCSTQIPVKLATSESVKIFWLDFTVTMAQLLCSALTSSILPLMLQTSYALH